MLATSLDFIIEAGLDFLNGIVTSIFDSVFEYILQFFTGDIVTNVLHSNIVRTANLTISSVATIFLGLLAAKHIIFNYYLELDGDKDMDPLQYLIKVSMATAMIQSAGFITDYIMKISGYAYKAVLTEQIYESFTMDTFLNMEANVAKYIAHNVAAIYILVFLICILVLLVKAAIRVAEVVASRLLLPLFACSIVTPSRELWNNFFMSYFVLLIGYIIPMFFLNISLRYMIEVKSVADVLMSCGCLFFAFRYAVERKSIIRVARSLLKPRSSILSSLHF